MKTDQQIIDDLVRREGDRYTNHPADLGGPTKYGITLKTLEQYRGRSVTPGEVERLTEAEARAVYSALFIDRAGFGRIQHDALRALVVDSGVQHGVQRVALWLQDIAEIDLAQRDGIFGPKSAAALNALRPRDVFAEVVARRAELYGRLITKDPIRVQAALTGYRLQAENAAGWANRLSEFIRQTAML